MNKQFINYNGEFYPAQSAVLSIDNRGYRYGDGLFESMRMCKGKLQMADLHADRLQQGMKLLKISGYSQIDAYFLKDKTEEICKRNKITANARLRLSVFRDANGFYTPDGHKFGYSLEAFELNQPYYELNTKGLIMDVYQELSKPVNKLSNLKTSNALLYIMAAIYKQQNRLDEAFILNESNFLCETISSNLFVVYQQQIYTPALSEGCIAGIMRQAVIKIAMENDIKITEAQINPEVLNQAEEVFLTNATNGIQWVMGYNRKRYFNETAKFFTEKLNQQIL